MFNGFAIALLSALFAVAACSPAWAYGHSNRYGGSTSASGGTASHTNTYGGSSSANASGASHSNVYGGGTSANASGASHTNTYGGTTSANSSGVYHNYPSGYSTAAYHPYYAPVPVYHPGCYNCVNGAAVAGAAVAGAAVGAAVASSHYAVGTSITQLPSGCASPTVGGVAYYQCSGTWFKPAYGSNGFYYIVVPAP